MSQDTTKCNTISILKIIQKLKIIQLISLEMYIYTSLAAKIIVANWLLSPHSARNVIVKAWISVLDTIIKLLLPIRNRHLFGRACCSMSLSYMKVNINVKWLFNFYITIPNYKLHFLNEYFRDFAIRCYLN